MDSKYIFSKLNNNLNKRVVSLALAMSFLLNGCFFKFFNKDSALRGPSNTISTVNCYDGKDDVIGDLIYSDYYSSDADYVSIFEEADICLAMVKLSSALEKFKEKSSKDTFNDVVQYLSCLMENPNFHVECLLTDSLDFYNRVYNEMSVINSESNFLEYIESFSQLSNLVNCWLLQYGYEITRDYCMEMIKYVFVTAGIDVAGEIKVIDAKSFQEVSFDTFSNKSNLVVQLANGQIYHFDHTDILKAYISMKYQNSRKGNGTSEYNKSRNDYILKAFTIIDDVIYSCSNCVGNDIYLKLDDKLKDYVCNHIICYEGTVEANIANGNNTIRYDEFYFYTFRKGDTLYNVAESFNTTIDYLLEINDNLSNRNDIMAGDVIKVPWYKKNLYDSMIFDSYVIQKGDDVYSICNRFGVSVTNFVIANPQISNLDYIFVGEVIHIPISDSKTYTSAAEVQMSEEESKEYIFEEEEEVSNITLEEAQKRIISFDDGLNEFGYVRGVDVSSFQGNIDWNKLVYDEQISFALLRAYSIPNGKFTIDSCFEDNFKACAELGLPIGIYTFFNLKNEEEVVEQAQILASKLDELCSKYDVSLQMPIYFDYEESAHTSNPEKSGKLIISALNVLEENGYYVGIYSNLNDKLNLDLACPGIGNYDSLIARYRLDDHYGSGQNTQDFNEDVVPTYHEYDGVAGAYQNYDNVVSDTVSGNGGKIDVDFAYVNYPKIIENMNKRNGLTRD